MRKRTVSSVVQKVFSDMLENKDRLFYEVDQQRADEIENCQYPIGPGGMSYKEDVTAFRITGADPGFPKERPKNVPIDVIHKYRESFLEGISIAFPLNSVNEYMLEKLKEKAFHKINDGEKNRKIEKFFLTDFPRILPLAPNENITNPFRHSIEHDIRGDFSDSADIHAIRHDRKNLSNKDLFNFYMYSMQNPELIAGLLLWQEYMADYCVELNSLIDEYFGISKNDSAESLNRIFPIGHLVRLTEGSIVMNNLPLYLGAFIFSLKRPHDVISPDILKEGILSAQKAGVFRRKFETDFGPRQSICPFGSATVRFLTADLIGSGNSSDITIARSYNKIINEVDDPEVKRILSKIKNSIGSTMKESHAEYVGSIFRGCPFRN